MEYWSFVYSETGKPVTSESPHKGWGEDHHLDSVES
jgi:hypothetical protein